MSAVALVALSGCSKKNESGGNATETATKGESIKDVRETKPVSYCVVSEKEETIDPEDGYDCRATELDCKNEVDGDEKCIPVTKTLYCLEVQYTGLQGQPINRWCHLTDDNCIEDASDVKANEELTRKGLMDEVSKLLRDCFVLE